MSNQSDMTNDDAHQGSHFQPSMPSVVIILLVFVLGAFLMLRSSSPSQPSIITTASAGNVSTSGSTPTTVVTKAQVRTQVANGTSTAGLARTYTQMLMTQGWDTLPEMNGPKVTATIVYYNPGFKWAAVEVAAAISVPQTAVQPLGGQNPVAGSSGDDVIVILGPDVAVKG